MATKMKIISFFIVVLTFVNIGNAFSIGIPVVVPEVVANVPRIENQIVLPKEPKIMPIPGSPVGSETTRKSKHKKKTRLIVRTVPANVNVFLNRVLIGQTPLDRMVNPGDAVTMTLAKRGYSSVVVNVSLKSGETFPLMLRLEKKEVWRPYVP